MDIFLFLFHISLGVMLSKKMFSKVGRLEKIYKKDGLAI